MKLLISIYQGGHSPVNEVKVRGGNLMKMSGKVRIIHEKLSVREKSGKMKLFCKCFQKC